jgi:hypothetical protein
VTATVSLVVSAAFAMGGSPAWAQAIPGKAVSAAAPSVTVKGPSVAVTAPAAPTVVPTGAAVTGTTVPAVPTAATVSAPGVSAPAATVVVGGPAAGPAPTVASPTQVASGDKPMDGSTYAVRLRDLEASVDELKDRIRRSHTRLALLSDTILSGGAAGSRAEIGVENEMSSAFRLTKALIVLDGAVQYNRSDESGALADQKSIPVFSGSVPPGDHTLQVVLSFQGNGYGVFSYLRSYHWDLKSSHSFTAVEGKTLTLTATALEKGGVTTPLDQRPSVEWKEKVQALSPGAGAALAAPAAPAAPAAGTTK